MTCFSQRRFERRENSLAGIHKRAFEIDYNVVEFHLPDAASAPVSTRVVESGFSRKGRGRACVLNGIGYAVLVVFFGGDYF